MNCYRRFLLILVCIFLLLRPEAQQAAAIDSIKFALGRSKTNEEKAFWLDNLSRTLMNVNLAEANEYAKKLITLAEESRDRKLMVFAYRSNGLRYSYFGGQREYAEKSLEEYNKALTIAKDNKFDDEVGGIYLRLSTVYLIIPDKEKALSFANQGFSLISGLKNDSLRAESYNTYGLVYLNRNEKILALRSYLTALRLVEEMKVDKKAPERKSELLRRSYQHLSLFYRTIGDYDRAIDYANQALEKLNYSKNKNVPYQRVIDINEIGNLFAAKESPDIAISYFERSLAMADSLKFSTLRIPAYVSIINQFLRNDKPMDALNYMNAKSGKELKSFLNEFGLTGVVDQVYGVIFTQTGQYDSARYYMNKALPYFETRTTDNNRILFYRHMANLYKKSGDTKNAITEFIKVKEMGEKIGHLESIEIAATQLDTLYQKAGNFQLASFYNGIHYQYKDSIEKLNKEKELSQIEAADEQQRQLRIEEEKKEIKRKKYNIQYLAITIGIAALFIVMVMMGMFKVSATTIKMVGFFAFLMFFEFIFLIFKKNIASLTDGEPWKDLMFMIGLAALLLPLHHWMEHRVIHYLTSHNRLTASGKSLIDRVLKRRKHTSP